MTSNLDRYKEELYEALYERLDLAFPRMEFKLKRGIWESVFHLDGSRASSVTTYVYPNRKWCIKDYSNEPINLIDFDMKYYSNSDFMTALKRLSDVCGLTLPNFDSQEWEEREKKERERKEALVKFRSALWSGVPEANRVLDYLRNYRKWTDEDIMKANLGYIDSEILMNIPKGFYASHEEKDVVGRSHRLVIPITVGSRLTGYKYRNIDFTEADKERGRVKYLNNGGFAKSEGLFSIPMKADDIIVVEGDLDALHAKVRGVENVVATLGEGINESQLKDALRRGVEKFTLLFDNDERGRGFTKASIDLIHKTGGARAYVASLKDCKDTDEYLSKHTIDEWKNSVNDAINSYVWLYGELERQYYETAPSMESKQRDSFLKDVESLLNAPSIRPDDRELIYGFMTVSPFLKSNLINVNEIRSYIDGAYYRAQAYKRSEDAKKVATEVNSLLAMGRTDEALKLMREASQRLGSEEKAVEYAKTFKIQTVDEIEKEFASIPEGLPTGFIFEQGHKKEELTLCNGITFVCAPTGHGKTTFLNNIALNVARNNYIREERKRVLYFTYEMSGRDIKIDLLNTYINDKELSESPVNTIKAYYKGSGAKYFRGGETGNHYVNFIEKKDSFLKEILGEGFLQVIDKHYKIEELLEAIEYYINSSAMPISLICIDYAQLLYSEESSKARTEEIKKIVNEIKNFAIDKGLPFLIACQFNRQVVSPLGVEKNNIGEGGDFERIADTIVGLFNLKELKPNTDDKKDVVKLLNELLPSINYSTIEEVKPIQNIIFARLLKRRGGEAPIDKLLSWEGRTKFIEPNYKEALAFLRERLFLEKTRKDESKKSNKDKEGKDFPF